MTIEELMEILKDCELPGYALHIEIEKGYVVIDGEVKTGKLSEILKEYKK